MCTIRECKEGEDFGNFFVIKDLSPRELNLRANLCPIDIKKDASEDVYEHTKWLKSTSAMPRTSGIFEG